MAIEIQPIQQKKKHTGFFVLLAIIAIAIFAAYSLTSKKGVNTTPGLSINERQAIVEAFKDSPSEPLSEKEKKAAITSVSVDKTNKQFTDAEKQSISSQFQN